MLPIVVVDDSPGDLILAERVLRQCKILNPIHPINGGNGCIAWFEGVSPYERRTLPCLVLLDLVMPTPGAEVLKYLQEKGLATTSILVMLSGLQDLKAIHQGYQFGARTFLIKPINEEDVLQMLSALKGVNIAQNKEGYVVSLDGELPSRQNLMSDPAETLSEKARP